MCLCLKAQLKAPKVGGSLKRDFTFKPPSVRIQCSLPRKAPNSLHLAVHKSIRPQPQQPVRAQPPPRSRAQPSSLQVTSRAEIFAWLLCGSSRFMLSKTELILSRILIRPIILFLRFSNPLLSECRIQMTQPMHFMSFVNH